MTKLGDMGVPQSQWEITLSSLMQVSWYLIPGRTLTIFTRKQLSAV